MNDSLMCYFVVATLHLYRESIAAVRGPQTYEEFQERNPALIEHVRNAALERFNYELTQDQMDRAVLAYVAPGMSLPIPTAKPPF